MKRILKALFISIPLSFFWACSDNHLEENPLKIDPETTNQAMQAHHDRCATMQVLAAKLQEDPGLQSRMQRIEAQTRRFMKQAGGASQQQESIPYDGMVTVPVYVNVIYNTPEQNISDDQIASQIAILNADFRRQNEDINQTPEDFKPLVSDLYIQFELAGTVRKFSRKKSWNTNDAMKFSKKGGIDASDPGKALNIWVCNLSGGILGYAQFPGGNEATDGIVVGPQYFGNTGYVQAPFDKGRTATHEVGHWLNLRHIWGDGGCGIDDFVEDTPVSDGPNYGCPGFPTIRCNNTNMTMNFMDYTDDACMYMFTHGQKNRTRALFASDGARSALVQ